jgi:hypothetical protein
MNPKLIPILERIIAHETILQSFHSDSLPQAALAYVRQHYLNDNFIWLTPEEQDLIEELPPFADNINESIRPGGGIGNPDSSVYHLFDDGSLWLKTNAYSSIWLDARNFAVETILLRMTLSRLDADLLRAIGMDDHIDEVRDDFFGAFAHVLHLTCGIAYCDAREHWNAWTRQLGDGEREKSELGGAKSGHAEGERFASEYTTTKA